MGWPFVVRGIALTLLCVAPRIEIAAAEPPRPNVLLICVDDLKPALGCYGERLARSPNIDRLAARGILFERAYCNQAVCAPSRNSLLTGLRPQTLGIYDLGTNFRRAVPDAITLPQWFKQHGYRTEGLGKIFHVGHGNQEDPRSWSVPHFKAEVVAYAAAGGAKRELTREEALFANKSPQGLPRGAAYEAADVPDNAYPDGALADEAIGRLHQRAENADEPFFLALGFVKPHLPFCAPKKYWDLHDPAAFELAERPTPPGGAPPYAPQFGGELRQYAGVPEKGPIPADMQRMLIHGYFAAVSYMDAQLGRVLDELDRLKLAERTIIVLWGDHGWHLGDHGIWCKHTNYEQATHIPLLVVAPGVTKAGGRTTSLAETVDLYPTLCELVGLPIPQPPHALDGNSFVAALRDPHAAMKEAIFHVYPRNPREKGPLLGRAVRTDRYRLVEWKRPGTDAGAIADLELYDYQTDPAETRNLAGEQPETVARLQAILAKQPAARPQVATSKTSAAEDFAAVALAPFWRAPRLAESMFFIQKDKDARPQSALLFQPAKVLSVTSATRETVFEEGRDYVLDEATATLRLPAGSRIPFKTIDELYPLMTSDAPKIARQGGDKTRGVFFDNAAGYHKLQVEVTYEPQPGQWKGPLPHFAGNALPRTLARLGKKEPVKLMLLGDSISAGYNASKFSQIPPGCPAYGELVALALTRRFDSPVDFKNYAVGGWNAGQGLKHAREDNLGKQKPDLVLIAFGMNDVFARDATAYEKHVRGIIETIRAQSPDTEFILVASMLGNAEWGMPMDQFPQYRDALARLIGPGIALADLTVVWEELLKRKSFFDLTGNGVNHPNDFGHCIYAQTILSMFVEESAPSMLQRVEGNVAASWPAAVLVDDVPLIHTAQLLPLDDAGKVVAPGDPTAQVERLVNRLDAVLRDAGSSLPHVAKLNLYLAREELVAAVQEKLAARFPADRRPAASLVVTALPDAEALVTLDAVALAPAALAEVKRGRDVGILPAGSRIYISGQAEPGALREATRKTLESLTASLKHCGRTDRDVVQLKCFLTPMQSVVEVQEEIASYYGKAGVPAVSFIEWRSSAPIEIELIAWGGPANADAKEPLEFLTPPALKASPLYSRIARIHRGGTIFISDQLGSAAGADEQATEAFANLGKVLAQTGSDWKHLVKATYYVTDDEISKAHNAIRPKHYDPERPPAASKAMVAGTGRPGVRYSMDMIAVPVRDAK
jgi:iduronate 2-sulfatase